MTTAGLSKAGLARMHDVLAGHVESGDVPGLVSVVSRRGEVSVDPMGTLDVGGARGPVRADAIFRISSMTKPVTAVATLILVEECVLRLDEPVDRLLPELAGRRVLTALDAALDDTVAADRPVTVRDLLTFRMGFGILMLPPGMHPIQRAADELRLGQGPPQPAVPPDPDTWIRGLGSLPLMRQPGSTWMYSTGADVLGVLIARAAGKPFDTFLRERIFEPLGMRDTGFSVPAGDVGRFATGYATSWQTGALEVYDEAEGGQWSSPPAFPGGAAGLVSTASDFVAFGEMLLHKGAYPGGRILSRPTVETMTTDQLTAEQKARAAFLPGGFDNVGWGFGLSVQTRRVDPYGPVGRFGWDGGLGTTFSVDPTEDMVTILLTQRGWASPQPPPVATDFWTTAYAAIED